MNKEKVISEVNQIICMLEEDEIAKIPKKIVDFFKKNSVDKAEYKLDKNKLLEEQNLSEETLDMLTFIYSYIRWFIKHSNCNNITRILQDITKILNLY